MKAVHRSLAGLTAASLLLGACATEPRGPRVAVMPGPNKPFEVFAQERQMCEQYADSTVRGDAESANNRAVGGAILGTLLGAGLGAAAGGGRGAAIGAGAGAVVGTGIGASGSQAAQYSIQQRFDMSYAACMAGKGNQVPGYAAAPGYAQPYAPGPGYGPPPAYAPPPGYPPPGYPPPGY
jgi:uncharacterized protein YcfJ